MPDPKFKWSAKRREYVYGNGRAVSADTLAGWVSTAADNAEQRLRTIAERYVEGKINHAEWVLQTKDEIRRGVRGMAQLANGGQLDKQTISAVGNAVKAQYKFFSAFSNAVENGEVPLGKKLIARAGLYGANQYVQFQHASRAGEKASGARRERNVLGAAEHCAGCIRESARGWVSIGKLVPIGNRECRARCRCRLEFSK